MFPDAFPKTTSLPLLFPHRKPSSPSVCPVFAQYCPVWVPRHATLAANNKAKIEMTVSAGCPDRRTGDSAKLGAKELRNVEFISGLLALSLCSSNVFGF